MKLTIIIVNYNVKCYLHQCLSSVERALRGIDGEIVVVDNHSTDGSVPFLKKLHPSVRFINNEKNLGFAKANNLALRDCVSEYALLLNPDTIVGEDTLRECVEWMDNHSGVGAVGVKMLNADGTFAKESRRAIPTPWVSFCKMTRLCHLFPHSRWLGRYYMDYLDRESPAEIEIVSGAYTMLNVAALNEVGLLDEDFFMYGEDIDLSYRLLRSGYHNYYVPTRILHYKGESTQKSSFGYVNVFHKAMLLFFRKHFGTYNLFISIPVKFAIWMKAILACLRVTWHRKTDDRISSLEYMRRMSFGLWNSSDRMEAEYVLGAHGIHLSETLGQVDYVVVNAEQTPFSEILHMLENQTRDPRMRIATLYPSIHTIVTNSYVFQVATNS